MNIILAIPFLYFYSSRIKKGGSIFFNLLFEWIPWLILILCFSKYDSLESIRFLFLSYIAFISLYEIGYIANDYFSINFEEHGRDRAPISFNKKNIIFWVLFRFIIFFLISNYLPFGGIYGWNIIYIILLLFFTLHNLIKDLQLKSITFFWLALLKYIIPVVFIVREESIYPLLLIATVIYVPFRFLSYLESKNLLLMNKRKTANFRTFYFSAPIVLSVFLIIIPNSSLYFSLSIYYALIILVYFLKSKLNLRN